MIKRILLLALMLPSCGFTEDERTQAGTAGALTAGDQCVMESGSLRSGGSGLFRLGTAADSILARCPSAIDTVEFDAEGNPERVINVKDSVGAIRVEIAGERAWRIRVTTPRATTDEGIGVGDRVTDLLALPDIEVLTGEGQLFVTSSAHCGLSFRLDHVPEPAQQSRPWTRSDLERLRSSAQVEEVLVFECDEG